MLDTTQRAEMKSNVYVVKDGVHYMVVKPVKSLFHSSLVHDVLTRGDKFVVNMGTGELTILSAVEKATKKPDVQILLEMNSEFTVGRWEGDSVDKFNKAAPADVITRELKSCTSAVFYFRQAGATRVKLDFNPALKVPEQFMFEINNVLKRL